MYFVFFFIHSVLQIFFFDKTFFFLHNAHKKNQIPPTKIFEKKCFYYTGLLYRMVENISVDLQTGEKNTEI